MASAAQNFLNSNSLFNNHNNVLLDICYVKGSSSCLVAEQEPSFLIEYNSNRRLS